MLACRYDILIPSERPLKVKKKRQALPKEVRKQQLIHATINCIARHGLSAITMARVTQEAGLSMGIANLHFESKENLLKETLLYVTEEYNKGQRTILESGDFASTAAKIKALLDFHFSVAVTQETKMAVWFAFYGEAKSRPTYQKVCSLSDAEAALAVQQLFALAIREGKYHNLDAGFLAAGYTALIDGLWLNLLTAPQQLNRNSAKKVARHYLANAFPDHIAREG